MVVMYLLYVFVLWHFQDFWGDKDEASSDEGIEKGDDGVNEPLLDKGAPETYTKSESEAFTIGKRKKRRSAVTVGGDSGSSPPFVKRDTYTYLNQSQQEDLQSFWR